MRDPEETFQRILPYFVQAGITRIADVTGLDIIGIPVCTAIRPNAKSLSVSQGKGVRLISAKVSAAMEAIELYHAENVTLPRVTASYRDLCKQAYTCDPSRLNLHPQTRYHEELPLEWVKGFDLIQQRDVFVPYDLVHCSLLAEDTQAATFFVSSTGLASGNHFLEATSHALCEVVERDATYLWRLKTSTLGLKTRCVDLKTVQDPMAQMLFQKLTEAGLLTLVWDMTHDVGMPVFGCVIMESQDSTALFSIGVYHGFGCHLNKEVALMRAVTEAVQSRLTYISGARDDVYRETYEIAQSTFHQDVWQRPFLTTGPGVDFRELPSLATNRLDLDVAVQLDQLKKAGFSQAVVVNLSRPEFDIAVVRVIIPGMGQSTKGPSAQLSARAKNQLLQEMMVHKLLRGDFA